MRKDGGGGPRSEIGGRDVDEARALYEDAYNGHDFLIEPTDGPFAYRYTTAGDAAVRLHGNLFLGRVRGAIRTEGEYIVTWLTAGEGVMDVGGDEVVLERGVPAVFPTGKDQSFDFHDHKQNLLHVDGPWLERVAAEEEGVEGRLHFHHAAGPRPGSLPAWTAAVTTAARAVLGEQGPATGGGAGTGAGGATDASLVRAEALREVAVALLRTFPHEAYVLPDTVLAPRNARLREAVEHMHAHAHLPLDTTTVARQVDLTVRGLQQAFTRHLGVTPTEYLRGIRLDRARLDLAAADPSSTTVADVARRWGFAHLGRFAASYAERHGEYPSETLAR